MCSVCLANLCRQGCPNSPDPVSKYTCNICRNGIYEGDKYFDSSEGFICKDCLDDLTVEEIMKMCGEKLQTV